MPIKTIEGRITFVAVLLVVILTTVGIFFHNQIIDFGRWAYMHLTDRQQVEEMIASFGVAGPLVFMLIQILQVLFAPIPGEATGFVGGYLFGTAKGFLYSSMALTVGSWINFLIGRFLGERYVRKIIPADKMKKFNRLVKREGVFVLFLLFVFPGFPKDWLCLFLGVSALPVNVFMLIAAIGRMPGTLLLSLQGEFLHNNNYGMLVILMLVSLIAAGIAFYYRESIYRWIEKMNGNSN